MKKPVTASPRRRPRTVGNAIREQVAISEALDRIDEIEPQTQKSAKVIALLRAWLKDKSGYDEKAWPKLKTALNQERARRGAQGLFDE